MPNYLPEMLEVPWIEGQSECPCGNDDRYYAFGLWTDYCGMSMKELKKYNSFCGENCEGGGGGCQPCPCPPCPDPPEPPEPPTPTPTEDPGFRFTYVSTNDSDSSLLNSDFVASMVEGFFYTRNYIEMEWSLGQPQDSYSPYEFRIYTPSVPIDNLDNMSDAEAERIIRRYGMDIVFAVDTEITSWTILDGLGLPFETPGYEFNEIGQVPYEDRTYKILRYKNPMNLSPVYDSATEEPVRSFVIKFIKN